MRIWTRVLVALLALTPVTASAAEATLNLTTTGLGLSALAVFVIAYLFVIAEEVTELRKSIPVVLAAGLVWLLVAIASRGFAGLPRSARFCRVLTIGIDYPEVRGNARVEEPHVFLVKEFEELVGFILGDDELDVYGEGAGKLVKMCFMHPVQ